MSLSSMRRALAEAIAGDNDIRTWAELAYGQEHNVYLDVDVRNMPGEDACPYVVVTSLGQSVAQNRREKEYYFSMICFVHDATGVATVHDNLHMQSGGENAEAFRKLVETAVVGVLEDETLEVDVDADAVTSFPFIRSEMILKIISPVLIGENPLA